MSYDNLSSTDHRKSAAIIKSSGLFDVNYYTKTYPQIANSGMDPLDHFIRFGASAGLNPNKSFNTVFYLAENNHIYSKGINPLVHYIEFGRSSNIPTAAVNEIQAFDAFDRALRSGMFTASPTAEQIESVSFGSLGCREPSSTLALPPLQLAERVGSPSLTHFEQAGQSAATAIRRLVAPFSFEGKRCMDFGCGAGRIIRNFAQEAKSAEIWGCDIDGTSIYWLLEHLSPPFRFFQLGDAPSLPFEDNSFDLVCAIGVFCQIFKDWQLWALEIRRILKPGGRLIMTYNGQGVFETTFPHRAPFDDFMAGRGMYVMKPYLSWNQGGPQVIHSPRWVQRMWGCIFDIDYIACSGFMDYQDLCMMRKPIDIGGRVDRAPAVHRLGTSQEFNQRAVGRIDEQYDLERPFLESYGIEASRGRVELTGWIAFERDTPATAQLCIEGVTIPCETTFTRDAPQPNWDADRFTFAINADCTSVPLDRSTVTLRLTSSSGIAHNLSMSLQLK